MAQLLTFPGRRFRDLFARMLRTSRCRRRKEGDSPIESGGGTVPLSGAPFRLKQCAPILVLAVAAGWCAPAAKGADATAPATAREFYNKGTGLLAAKKYSASEQMFLSALAAQEARVQPPALYNLGHARFDEGLQALKKKPSAGSLGARGNAAGAAADLAIQRAGAALAGNDLSKLVAAYLDGHGARRNLERIEKALRQAIAAYGQTLRQWQRAADDFKSAAELNPSDSNAARNAQIVEQYIARLVDSLRQMQRLAAMLGTRHSHLNKLLRQIGGRIPKPDLPPGAPGDDHDNGGLQPESLRGLKEGATRIGQASTVPLSPDEAAQLLNGIPLDSARRLPLTETKTGRTLKNSGLTW